MEYPRLSSKPNEVQINRGILWPITQRKSGDGKESEIEINRTSQHPQTSCVHIPSQSTTMESRPSSPIPCIDFNTREKLQRSPVSPLPASPRLNHSSYNEKNLEEEKYILKDHLRIQIQVNQELKRLLVASVGEELGYHYERLATEKAQLALEIGELGSELAKKKDELERLEITCDVWRSKFLASRLQCDGYIHSKMAHERKAREMESGVRGLLQEHWRRSESIQSITRTLENLKLNLKIDDQTSNKHQTMNEYCNELANEISNNLLEDSKQVIINVHNEVPLPTPGEKYVLQLLSEHQKGSTISLPKSPGKCLLPHSLMESDHSTVIDRFHSKAVFDNVTLNCCVHCKGDIQVV